VDRSSLDLTATYAVNAELTVGTGELDVSTTLVVRNDGETSIDRLELNTIAARLGRLHVTAAAVDDRRVKVRIDDQTLRVPLGGILEPGFTTTVRISYRATLRAGLTGSDWLFSRAGGTVALYRWIPWISRATPFDRPNTGDPFVTVSSPQVSVELLTDLPLVLAAPTADVAEFVAGRGKAWSFTVRDVRDVALVLAPDLTVRRDEVNGVKVLAYSRYGDFAATRLLDLTTTALREERRILGADYPWKTLVAVETPGGEAMESPGQIWIPRSLDTLNRTYLVHHEVAHQWFYGLVGNDQRDDPFLDEATADQLARSAMGGFRSTRCSRVPLDGSIARYQGRCYYEVILVQGGLLLDDVRARIGSNRYWKAMADFLAAHRFGIVTTRDLLEALEAAAPPGVKLRSLFRERFPALY
jgi:aminopeptidase N